MKDNYLRYFIIIFIMTLTNEVVLIEDTYIRDAFSHTYRDVSTFKIVGLYSHFPQIRALDIFVYNSADQAVTIQPLTNVRNDKTYMDANYSAISSFTVDPDDHAQNTSDFIRNPTPYIALQATYSTAPTSGYLYASVFLFY